MVVDQDSKSCFSEPAIRELRFQSSFSNALEAYDCTSAELPCPVEDFTRRIKSKSGHLCGYLATDRFLC